MDNPLLISLLGMLLALLAISLLLRRERGQRNREISRSNQELLKEIRERDIAREALRSAESRFRAIFDNAPVGIFQARADGRLTQANAKLATMLGYEDPGELLDDATMRTLLSPEHAETSLPGDEGESVTSECRLKSVTGDEIWGQIHLRRLPEGKDATAVYEGFVTDITKRRQFETLLRREHQVSTAIASLADALLDKSKSLRDISNIIHERALSLTGSEQGYVSSIDPATGENVGHNLSEMMGAACRVEETNRRIAFPPGPDGRFRGLYGVSLNTGEAFITENPGQHPASRGLPEGHVPLDRFLSVPAKAGGRIVGQIALSNSPKPYTDWDLKAVSRLARLYALAIERMRTEERLEKSLAEKDVLLREIHHRVKNNLQIISSLLSLQAVHTGTQSVQDILMESRNRISTMALVHEELYQNESLAAVNMHTYANRLLARLMQAFDAHTVHARAEIQELDFSLDQAIPCGLIITELVTNALKHAFGTKEAGRRNEILLGLARENGLVRLVVSDNGHGLPEAVSPQNTDTLGFQLVTSLVDQLHGELSFRRERGTTFIISF